MQIIYYTNTLCANICNIETYSIFANRSFLLTEWCLRNIYISFNYLLWSLKSQAEWHKSVHSKWMELDLSLPLSVLLGNNLKGRVLRTQRTWSQWNTKSVNMSGCQVVCGVSQNHNLKMQEGLKQQCATVHTKVYGQEISMGYSSQLVTGWD